ncbi:MAG: 16S rRNA (cytidine(1402)-2'-O)-methyltransferase [Gammaproteobacteria bacterium]|nr:16S rRNA (cytidine(1402)-2'-O)-methyltransferase [Gammaproteobacteria bacterium]
MSNQNASLYIVSTPIGNLEDISQRAITVLQSVELIAAEDTRHSSKLLQHLSISTPCLALHEHNERDRAASLIKRLQSGESIALISDAGTPLLSDPGYHMVKMAHAQGIPVVPVPGASALLAALVSAGLPTDRFVFEGFLPSKQVARQKALEKLKNESGTLVFYEAPHRILSTLQDMAICFGDDREAVLARELTKTYETVQRDSLAGLVNWVEQDSNQQRGEIVLVVAGAAPPDDDALDEEALRILNILLAKLSVKQAASLAAEITGQKKNRLYQLALELADKNS